MEEQCGRVRGYKGSEAVRWLRRPVQSSIGGSGSGGGRWIGGGDGWGFSNRAQAYETASLAHAVARALLAMHVNRSNGCARRKQGKKERQERVRVRVRVRDGEKKGRRHETRRSGCRAMRG